MGGRPIDTIEAARGCTPRDSPRPGWRTDEEGGEWGKRAKGAGVAGEGLFRKVGASPPWIGLARG
jgi:hypothetical protein